MRLDTIVWVILIAVGSGLTACGSAEMPEESEDRSLVTVSEGQLSGARSTLNDDVWVYRGIPFAAPPVGDLRWHPPEPVAPWEGVRDATVLASPCMQPSVPAGVASFYSVNSEQMEEDCLYLNVWSAAGPEDRVPVLVWIHGGGLVAGNGSDVEYDGTALATRGVVLVTINYRLGALGYLAHPLLSAESPHDASGNYGTLDQVTALEWVQQNIAAFGGDPSRVTIFGESAGSWSVNHMMTTPLARGLFHGAIGESGGGFGSVGQAYPKAEIEAAGERFMAAVLGPDVDATVEQMRSVSAADILAAPPELVRSSANVDGWVFPDTISNIFAAGEQADIPVIVGSNADESTMLGGAQGASDLDEYRATVQTEYGDLADAFLRTYPAENDAAALQGRLASATDAMFGWEMRTWARMMDTVASPAYLYFFSRVPPAPDADQYGSYHTAEIPYVFDNFGVSTSPHANRDYNDTDRALSNILASYWVNFAATGNPNGEGLPNWPVFDREADTLLEFGDTVNLRQGVRKDRLDFFDQFYAAQQDQTN